MGVWKGGYMDTRMNAWIDKWMNGWVDRWMDGQKNEQMYVLMNG